jgi:hypothetical protein
MATRSMIAIKNTDDTYDGVYCHFDGYPYGEKSVGSTLSLHYKTEEKIRELISRGGMSCVRPEIKDCEFYTKRGEELHNYPGYTLEKLKKKASCGGCEYMYIFNLGEWFCTPLHNN